MLSIINTRYRLAIAQAFFVTFLWSTSFVLIKIGLEDIPALTFAGLRYGLAFLILLVIVLKRPRIRQELRSLRAIDWWWFLLLGIIYYTINQGVMFMALERLPGVTLSLLLNFTTLIVAGIGIIWLAEYPTRIQWLGIVVFLAGAVVYFYPVDIPTDQWVGLGLGGIVALSTSIAGVIGRLINRDERHAPLTITLVSMGIGAGLLLAIGIITQGFPPLSLQSWLIVIWLAGINTAFAFTLWNQTLRTLSAVESNVINNTMLVQIAILAWVFLDEGLTTQEIMGLILASLGVLVVNLNLGKSTKTTDA